LPRPPARGPGGKARLPVDGTNHGASKTLILHGKGTTWQAWGNYE